jgi:hypothetical protein
MPQDRHKHSLSEGGAGSGERDDMQIFLTDGTDCEVVTASTTIPGSYNMPRSRLVHRTRGLSGFAAPSSATAS